MAFQHSSLGNRFVAVVLWSAVLALGVALVTGRLDLSSLASLGYTGVFLLSLINGAAPFPGPSQVATFLVARVLNPYAVGLFAGLGGALGEIAGYLMGRSGRAALTPRMMQRWRSLEESRVLRVSKDHAFLPLFILAAVPNPLFDPASVLSGALQIPFWRYFVPVLLGKLVRHMFIAVLGHATAT